MRNGKKEYDLYKNKLLQLIKTKGILVKKWKKATTFWLMLRSSHSL